MKLTKDERQSALWQKISAYLEDNLQRLRIKNDGDKSPEETAKLRGQIVAVKKFLAMGEDEQVLHPSPGKEADGFY